MKPKNICFGVSIFLLLACGEKEIETIVEPATEPATEEPAVEPSEEAGTDEDGDGFTVEEGDCDDSDPWTNPAREEKLNDQKDNDCDGRIDEKWSGVTVSLANSSGTSSLMTLNSIGQIESELNLDNDCVPTYLAHGFDGGYVISHANTALAEISETGQCTVLIDFSEAENPDLFSVTAHPDGYYIASRGNSLIRINRDGTIETLAEWDASEMTETGDINPNYQLYVWSIARDIRNNEIALFGFRGGFATWSAENGFVQHKRVDLENWDGYFAYSGTAKDGGGWYSLLYNGETSEITVANFDFSQNDWQQRIAWTEQDQSAQEFALPQGITINGDYGDYYVTADVATFSSVFRIREQDSFIDDLYRSDSQPSWTFYGIISNY